MSRSTLYSIAAGAAAAALATVVIVMLGLAAGLWTRPHLLVGPAGVGAAVVVGYLAHRRLAGPPFRLGALGAGAAALLTELVASQRGIGVVQVVALVVSAGVAAGGPTLLRPLTRPLPRWLVRAGLIAVALVLVRIVVEGGQLGHDEAAYAVKARAWVAGTPDTGWSIHRGIGQSALAAAVFLPFRQSPTVLRLVSVVLSMATVVAVWALGRSMRSSRAGLVAAVVVAVAPSFLRRGAEFLTDVPSTGLLVVVALLLWRWLDSRPARHGFLYWAVGVGAVAVYVRYQSLLSLGLLAVGCVVVGWERMRDRWPAAGRAAVFGLVLLLPHLVYATVRTGAPWGVVLATAQAGARAYVGEGLVDYARDLPDLLAGQLGAIAVVASVVWLGWAVATGEARRPTLFLMIPALAQVVLLGLVSHGEPRFVFFPVALMAVGAGIGAEHLRRRVSPTVYRTGVVALVVAMIVSLGLHGDRADRNAEARAETVAALVEAARAVRTRMEGRCGILTGYRPQLTWLSGCPTEAYGEREPEIRFPPGVDVFLVLAEEGVRQPEGELREEYLTLTDGDPTIIPSDGSLGDVEVWRLER